MRPLRLEVTESETGRAVVVKLVGEFDLSVEDLFAEAVTDGVVQDGHASVVLDLSELTFLDVSALHAFLRARANAGTSGTRLVLLKPSRAATRLLDVSGLTDRFEIAWDTASIDR
jgi:anti-anti-sigma factor